MVTKAKLLPNFPQAFVGKLSKVLLLTSVGILTASPGWAVVVAPTSLTVSVPVGSNNAQADSSTQTYSLPATAVANATNTYVDDVLLRSITFSGVTFQRNPLNNPAAPFPANGSFRDGLLADVTTANNTYAIDYGDNNTTTTVIEDNNSDGNDRPNATASGDAAVQAAFNSLSISQGVAGVSGSPYSYNLLFDNGIVDDNTAADNVPELIMFERGFNDNFTVRAIIGGSLGNFSLSPLTLTILKTSITPSGVFINTNNTSGTTQVQQVGVVGIDLNEFGLTTATQAIYGIQVSAPGGSSAADITGQFLASSPTVGVSNNRFVTQNAVPEPLTILGSGMALGFGALMKRQYARKRKD